MIAFTPFVDPFHGAWDWWYVLLPPLALGIALVYKAMRCEDLSEVPRQTAVAFVKLLVRGEFKRASEILKGK